MFPEAGKLAKGYVTTNFACLSCHKDRVGVWTASVIQARDIHTLGN